MFRLGWRPPARHQVVEDVPVSPRTTTLMRDAGAPRAAQKAGASVRAASQERTELLLSWRHTGFSVHNRVRVEPEDQPAQFVRRIAAYSNVSRGKRRKAEAENGEVGGAGAGPASRAARAEARNARALRRSWAQLIKRIYEVDPLVCPTCGSEMKVIAFITEHDVVEKILRHLKRRDEEGRGCGPPGREELEAVS